MKNNYQCVNISSESYTGKEQSPKGLGYSAVPYNIGFEKEGVDKQLWVVQMKNNKKVWFRKNGMPKVTHEEPLITINTIEEPKIEIKEGNVAGINTVNSPPLIVIIIIPNLLFPFLI